MTDDRVAFGAALRDRKISLLIISSVALIVYLVWPTNTPESPFWEVWVVNEAGQPIEAMTVTLTYENYSAEYEGHSEHKYTDANGYVDFSPTSLRASRLRRIAATLRSAEAGTHASFGPHAWVMASGNGLDGIAVSDGYVTDWTGAPPRMASNIVAKPAP
jgi:hypothetical protein